MSILSDEERRRLDERLKHLTWRGSLFCASSRAELIAEFETAVLEACAELMDDLSHADPLKGSVWSICKVGARRIREKKNNP